MMVPAAGPPSDNGRGRAAVPAGAGDRRDGAGRRAPSDPHDPREPGDPSATAVRPYTGSPAICSNSQPADGAGPDQSLDPRLLRKSAGAPLPRPPGGVGTPSTTSLCGLPNLIGGTAGPASSLSAHSIRRFPGPSGLLPTPCRQPVRP